MGSEGTAATQKAADAYSCGFVDESLDEFKLWLDAHPEASPDEYPWPEGPRGGREYAKAQST
jgi:hypothetical protein